MNDDARPTGRTSPRPRRASGRRHTSRDAARIRPQHQPAYGNLPDVPLSVWPVGSGNNAIIEAITTALTRPGNTVAITRSPGGTRCAALGRQALLLCDKTEVEAEQLNQAMLLPTHRTLATIHPVTSQNVSCRLAARPETLHLLIAGDTVRWCEGFWTCAKRSLRPGRPLAIISPSLDPRAHTAIHDLATAAGLRYSQHIITCPPRTLDRAVAFEESLTPTAGRSHRAEHVNVFLFTRPEVGA